MVKGKQRSARKKWLNKLEEEGKKMLYICTYEFSLRGTAGYRVQAIRLSDLYRFSDIPEPNLLHEVAFLHGDEVPLLMSFGVFGSRIVLLGGRFFRSVPSMGKLPLSAYVLDTKEPNPSFISSTSDDSSTTKPSLVIPELGKHEARPWLPEIDGKLYALSYDSSFDELLADPEDEVDEPKWNPLPRCPIMPRWHDFHNLDSSTCGVLGTRIFVTVSIKQTKPDVIMFCFDVAHPERQWTTLVPPCSDYVSAFPDHFNKALIFDLENNYKEKLMFSFDFDYNQIRVSSMMLSKEGYLVHIRPLSKIKLPAPAILPTSYNCVHLGGRKVCFLFMSSLSILVFTFEFSYSKRGPFSVKHLGRLLFNFEPKCKLADEPSWGNLLGGCFVLNSIAPCQHTSQDPDVNEGDKL